MSLYVEYTGDFELLKESIRMAMLEHGYFYIKIPIEYWTAIKKLEIELQKFLKLPIEEKKRLNVRSEDGVVFLGYVAEGEENTPKATNSKFHDQPETPNGPDLVQKLSFLENLIDQLRDFGIKEEDLEKIEPIIDQIKKYIEFQNKIKFQIFRALVEIHKESLLVDLDFSNIEQYLSDTFIRCLMYPSTNTQEISMGAHTDIGLFTIILDLGKETCLEVKNNDDFLPVPAFEGYALVIAGEFFHYLCPDINPVVHRVKKPKTEERISIVNFVTPTEFLKVVMQNGPYDWIKEILEKEGKKEITYGDFMQIFVTQFRN